MVCLVRKEHYLYLGLCMCVEIWLKLMCVNGNEIFLSRPTPKDQDFYSEAY